MKQKILAAALTALVVSGTLQAASDERFIAGYAAAVLEREFSLRSEGLEVVGTEIRYPARGFGTLEKQQLIKSLSAVPGVTKVVLVGEEKVVRDSGRRPVTAASGTGDPGRPVTVASDEPLALYLSTGRLFEPLLADPRWPHFFASYNYYDQDGGAGIEHVGSVGFGETIAIVRKSYASNLRWEAGIQAGVFAIFDLNSDSKDLVNADYFVGPYSAFRYGDFSVLSRLYHQSSHLGDEYLLRSGIDGNDRVNLSYEALDLIVSYELPAGFRVYGGAARLFDTDPADLKKWSAEYGAEWRSSETILGGAMRPIAAIDAQHREETNWELDLSARVGVQVEDPGRFSQRLIFTLEYYDGHSPNGQFFEDAIRFYGFGMHFYF
ncbi:MAG: DUF1207 domain-containing protein [Burkholderiales bacterium]|nr:DUF1207 domain-containing protein [Phycisphaerae bacterium]